MLPGMHCHCSIHDVENQELLHRRMEAKEGEGRGQGLELKRSEQHSHKSLETEYSKIEKHWVHAGKQR